MREQANQEQKELQNERDKLLSQLKSSSEQVRRLCPYDLHLQFLAGNLKALHVHSDPSREGGKRRCYDGEG